MERCRTNSARNHYYGSDSANHETAHRESHHSADGASNESADGASYSETSNTRNSFSDQISYGDARFEFDRRDASTR